VSFVFTRYETPRSRGPSWVGLHRSEQMIFFKQYSAVGWQLPLLYNYSTGMGCDAGGLGHPIWRGVDRKTATLLGSR